MKATQITLPNGKYYYVDLNSLKTSMAKEEGLTVETVEYSIENLSNFATYLRLNNPDAINNFNGLKISIQINGVIIDPAKIATHDEIMTWLGFSEMTEK